MAATDDAVLIVYLQSFTVYFLRCYNVSHE
jgi:hypothetical protein